jgi:hypothetical protein
MIFVSAVQVLQVKQLIQKIMKNSVLSLVIKGDADVG